MGKATAMNKGKVGAIRQQALTTASLHAAEKHGKREDEMGKARRISDIPPLVFGSLDLRGAHEKHIEGVQQSGKTAALHILVQFPTDLPIKSEDDQRAMLGHAVAFVNTYHGGDAVFAARLDRDEKGQHVVDVFALPRHDFTYKDGRTAKRASVSKFSKENALKRFGKADPRSQGRAFQAAWFEYLQDEVGLSWVQKPKTKEKKSKDRLEPEAYGLKQDRERIERQRRELDEREKTLAIRERLLDAKERKLLKDEETISANLETLREVADRFSAREEATRLDHVEKLRRERLEEKQETLADLVRKKKAKAKPADDLER